MTPYDYMQAAVDHAKERQNQLVAKYAAAGEKWTGCASGWVDTPAGKLQVDYVPAHGRTTHRASTIRHTWKLGGKRIAADKIAAALVAG
jgi:hypothetical protein